MAQYWIAAGAVVLGSLLTLAGGWLTSRREHASWLRDQRANSYRELVLRSNQLQLANIPLVAGLGSAELSPIDRASAGVFLDVSESGSLAEAYGRTVRALMDAVSSVEVIGPERVAAAAAELMHALLGGATQPELFNEAESAFLSAARDALGTR